MPKSRESYIESPGIKGVGVKAKIPAGVKPTGLLQGQASKGVPHPSKTTVGLQGNTSGNFAKRRNAGKLPGAGRTPGPSNKFRDTFAK